LKFININDCKLFKLNNFAKHKFDINGTKAEILSLLAPFNEERNFSLTNIYITKKEGGRK
jgi:hypothetical protein